jgi:hypothetical protein
MRIREFAGDTQAGDLSQLLALTTFLKDRAEDENARAEISQSAFIDLAQSLGVNVTATNLLDMIAQPPLSNVLEPLEPNSNVIRFKGNTEAATGMSVDQARAVVDSNAKAALKRRQ